MTAPDSPEYLPREPLDLPRDPVEIPAHVPHPAHHEPHPHEHPHPEREQPMVKTLLSWSAPGRPFRERGKEYFVNALLITVLVEIILFFFAQYPLMAVVASLLFVNFALKIVPPHDFHYRISTEGITVEDHFYLWQELYDFYFKKREGIDALHIRTQAFIPGELTITMGNMTPQHLKAVLLPYLPYREVVKSTFMEKSGDWLSTNFPLEKAQKSSPQEPHVD